MTDANSSTKGLSVGMVLFPNLTLQDLAGPYDVLARVPGSSVHLVAASLEPVRTDLGLAFLPEVRFEDAPAFDILFVPGGPGQIEAMEDRVLIDFLRERGQTARYVTSVCTGSLLLGLAGLLKGYRATTHWRYHDLLALFGAEPVAERVVIDRNRITGGGVTSGLDFGLTLVATLVGEGLAKEIQLAMEYDPAPPFVGGSPKSADPTTLERVTTRTQPIYDKRRRQIERLIKNGE